VTPFLQFPTRHMVEVIQRDDGGASPATVREEDPAQKPDYARTPPPNWTSKWSWSAPGGIDRATRGAGGRVLFEAPDLHENARLGNLESVCALLDSGAFELESVDPAGRTALHFACGFGREEVTAELLERGCELEPRDDWSKSPVDWALQAKHGKCVEMLRLAAVKRGLWGGKGQVAPLKTFWEHCFGLSAEEVHREIEESAKEAEASYKADEEKNEKAHESHQRAKVKTFVAHKPRRRKKR